MTTATIKKVRTPDQLAALAALDMAVDGAKATTTAGVRQSFEGLRLVLTGADAEAFGPGSRGLVEAHYRSAWSKTISSAISTVVVAGVVDTGLAVTGRLRRAVWCGAWWRVAGPYGEGADSRLVGGLLGGAGGGAA